jgi:hypothetical protein
MSERDAFWQGVFDGQTLANCHGSDRHGVGYGNPCQTCTNSYIKMMTHTPDQGPWSVYEHNGQFSIESQDFRHDVLLRVTGDFFDDTVRREYAQHIVEILNAAPQTLPLWWIPHQFKQLRLFEE